MPAIREPEPPAGVDVRHAVDADLAALIALEHRTFASERISARQWRRHLTGSSAEILVATRHGDLIGAVVLLFRRGAETARLYSIAVATEARGHGIGEALLAAAERVARRRVATRLVLEVRSDNRAARRLYERCGYRRFALKPGYYEDGHDALRYRKNLAGAVL